MSDIQFDYNISSSLPAHPEDPASLGTKFLDTLDTLTRVDPTIFADWQLVTLRRPPTLPLETARSRIAEVIGRTVYRDDPAIGYTPAAFTNTASSSRRISLSIMTGGKVNGLARLETGDWKVLPDPSIVTYPIFKAALLAMIAIWSPIWAAAYASRMDHDKVPLIPGALLFPSSAFHIPWVAYLSAPLTTHLVLPPPEIQTERAPDGGLLMIATEERLDPTNPKHLRCARIIAETMITRVSAELARHY
jgi:Immunity protein 52